MYLKMTFQILSQLYVLWVKATLQGSKTYKGYCIWFIVEIDECLREVKNGCNDQDQAGEEQMHTRQTLCRKTIVEGFKQTLKVCSSVSDSGSGSRWHNTDWEPLDLCDTETKRLSLRFPSALQVLIKYNRDGSKPFSQGMLYENMTRLIKKKSI